MQKRIVVMALAAVVLAVVLFGVPLAIAVDRTIRADERGELERLAFQAAARVSPTYRTNDMVELPATSSDIQIALYDPAGRLAAGRGPAHQIIGMDSRKVVDSVTSRDMVVTVPVTSGEQLIAAVRVSSSLSAVQAGVWRAWGVMTGIAVGAILCAVMLAAVAARRLIQPLTRLEVAAHDLGDGNFGVRTRRSGLPEIDRAGAALNKTAERIGELVSRERSFSSHASHQLRTPVTRLRLQLESTLGAGQSVSRARTQEALLSVDHLSRTIDDLLGLARGAGPDRSGFDVQELLDELRDRWHGMLAEQGRPLRIETEDPPEPAASAAAVGQILDVLLDNAVKHGRGVVTVRARSMADALAIDVVDEGRIAGVLPLAPSGSIRRGVVGDGRIGLALACTLAQAEGGRLLQAPDETRTRFTLLLPTGMPMR